MEYTLAPAFRPRSVPTYGSRYSPLFADMNRIEIIIPWVAQTRSKKDITVHDLAEIELDTKGTFELGIGRYQSYRLINRKLRNPYDEVIYVEKDEQQETIKQLLQNNDSLLRILSQIDPNTLHAALNIDNLKRIQQVMSQNLRMIRKLHLATVF